MGYIWNLAKTWSKLFCHKRWSCLPQLQTSQISLQGMSSCKRTFLKMLPTEAAYLDFNASPTQLWIHPMLVEHCTIHLCHISEFHSSPLLQPSWLYFTLWDCPIPTDHPILPGTARRSSTSTALQRIGPVFIILYWPPQLLSTKCLP